MVLKSNNSVLGILFYNSYFQGKNIKTFSHKYLYHNYYGKIRKKITTLKQIIDMQNRHFPWTIYTLLELITKLKVIKLF